MARWPCMPQEIRDLGMIMAYESFLLKPNDIISPDKWLLDATVPRPSHTPYKRSIQFQLCVQKPYLSSPLQAIMNPESLIHAMGIEPINKF